MTRLKEEDIGGLAATWPEYERRLASLTGLGLLDLSARALGLDPDKVRREIAPLRVGAIPVSSGEGLIGGFAESLVSIAGHLGFVPELLPCDEAGFRAARGGSCDLFLWADDDTYLAENVRNGAQGENGWATGRGFASALARMAERKGLEKRALVLGAGPVGRSGAHTLAEAGYAVVLCDLDPRKADAAGRAIPNCRSCAPPELPDFPPFACLLDAAPTDACFPLDRLTPGACVAAPCVPCPWDRYAPQDACVWHDPLQLGTAVMLLAAAFPQS